jgi:hypothetical protein
MKLIKHLNVVHIEEVAKEITVLFFVINIPAHLVILFRKVHLVWVHATLLKAAISNHAPKS